MRFWDPTVDNILTEDNWESPDAYRAVSDCYILIKFLIYMFSIIITQLRISIWPLLVELHSSSLINCKHFTNISLCHGSLHPYRFVSYRSAIAEKFELRHMPHGAPFASLSLVAWARNLSQNSVCAVDGCFMIRLTSVLKSYFKTPADASVV